MHRVILIFLIFFAIDYNAQQLFYNGQAVDTILIESFGSYYHFDKKGTTTGEGNSYSIAYTKGKYAVNDYKRISFKSTCQPPSNKEKVKRLNKLKGSKLRQSSLDSLLKGLSEKYKKPTLENIGLTPQVFLELIREKRIRNITKAYKEDWRFKRSYSTKEQNDQFFKSFQNVDTFNLFLSTNFDTSGYVFVTDVADVINVYITTSNAKYRFEGKYPNDFKQPWYYQSGSMITAILNFTINSSLVQILPKGFYGKWTLELTDLANAYIVWYLRRQKIIFP